MKKWFLILILISVVLITLSGSTLASSFSFFDTFPGGKTIDLEKWNVSENGGGVLLEKGVLILDNLEPVSSYPFVDSNKDPFDTTEFEVQTEFKFEGSSGNPYGITFAVTPDEQPQDQTFGNSPYSNNRNFWMILKTDLFFGFGTTIVATKSYDNKWHKLIFKKKAGVSYVYFDDELLGISTLNWAKPTNIWFGLTNSLGYGPDQYPALHIRYIKVR
ncbi:hypothetical protein A2W32_01675 [candidate division WWE3 bacterium RBG_16_37_10]|uniref:3-keto-disaccharide hydrolase domain-containing protein n=1 Tax=candidate division WWE3 bacterium RBG_16_37_10 TaxID=1802610 RepID=A0A1F4USX0_UNCKA|nr:MAG: hypothetical protein A2W32_01675 [candidate division WWE3 bacterium RBG_16_37_10]